MILDNISIIPNVLCPDIIKGNSNIKTIQVYDDALLNGKTFK